MFKGVITALVTPFRSNASGMEIDVAAFDSLLEWQLESGVSGFVIAGTTGESATLTPDEKLLLFKRAVDVVNGRVPVIAGTGSNSTALTLELSEVAKRQGVDGLLLVSPYYNKPTQAGLYAHFSEVARAVSLPVVLYNIPGRTSVEIHKETIYRLAEIKNIVAIKEATGSADNLMDLICSLQGGLDVFSGEDSLTHLFMSAGGAGVISASSNVVPHEMCQIVDAGVSGNMREGLEAQLRVLPLIRSLFMETNPAPAKAALVMREKLSHGSLRLPLVSVSDSTQDSIRRALLELGLL